MYLEPSWCYTRYSAPSRLGSHINKSNMEITLWNEIPLFVPGTYWPSPGLPFRYISTRYITRYITGIFIFCHVLRYSWQGVQIDRAPSLPQLFPFASAVHFEQVHYRHLHQCVMLMFFHAHVLISCINVLAGGGEVCDTHCWNSPPWWPAPQTWMTTHLAGGGFFHRLR